MVVLFCEPPVDYPNIYVSLGCHLGSLTVLSRVKEYCDVDVRFHSFDYSKLLNSPNTIDEVLDEHSPDVVCISVITHSINFACDLSRAAKKRNCVVVWGGIYATSNAEYLAQHGEYIDYIVAGAGEAVIPDVINNCRRLSMSPKDCQPRIVRHDAAKERKRLTPPDLSVIPPSLISEHKMSATLEVTRGCSFKCKFCTLQNQQDSQGTRPFDEVRSELQNIAATGFRKTVIADNNFVLSAKEFDNLIEISREVCPEMTYRALVRLDLMSDSLLCRYRELGVDEILIGVEHVDPCILQSMGKTDDPAKWETLAFRFVIKAAEMGFLVHPIFMFGYPGETKETLKRNKLVACKLGSHENVEPFVSFITPHPGSPIADFVRKGLIQPITSDYSKYLHLYPVTIPVSFGNGAISEFVAAHNEIRTSANMTYRNPCFTEEFVRDYANLL